MTDTYFVGFINYLFFSCSSQASKIYAQVNCHSTMNTREHGEKKCREWTHSFVTSGRFWCEQCFIELLNKYGNGNNIFALYRCTGDMH